MLDRYQQLAVDSTAPRILLRAGAGSGKTHTLTARIVRLLGSCHPREILALTFTRKAASEMRERVAAAHPQGRRVLVSTFHSWAAGILREHHDLVPIARDFTIRDELDRDDLLKLCALELGKSGKKGPERDAWASRPLHPATRKRLLADDRVMPRYRQLMREAEALDYDMLETVLLDLLPRIDLGRYLHVLVDEYQDTSLTQQAILDRMNPPNLFCVGDHAQSIYGFRGARVEGFVEASQRPGWITLDLPRNYRSVPAIVETANRCAARMAVPGVEMEETRIGVGIQPVSVPTCRDRLAVWDLIAGSILAERLAAETTTSVQPCWRDHAILSPTWDLLEQLSEVLTASEIPHEVARKRLDVWESEEMRWFLDCLRVAINPDDHLALRSALLRFSPRITPGQWANLREQSLRTGRPILGVVSEMVACPPLLAIGALGMYDGFDRWQGVSPAEDILEDALQALHLTHRTLEPVRQAIEVWAAENGEADLQDLLTWYAGRRMTDPEVCEERDAVVLSTIHGAKGLEWPCVWVVGLEEGRLPRPGGDVEESRRLFYVACTRARDRLVLCVTGDHEASRFVEEIS